MTTAILQVLGDPKGYKTLRYVIDGKEYRESLPALAIYEWLEDCGKDSEIILLAPDSLITKIEDDIDRAVDLLRDREKFEKRILGLLDGIRAEVLMIPSVGTYSENNYTASFRGSVENTITYIFRELVKRGVDEIYADVSTGQNIYTTSMLEALRKYATYRKLRCILQGGSGVSLKLAYVPPVFVEGQEVNVELHDFDVKAFFSLPTSNPKGICMDRDKRRELHEKYGRFLDELSKDLKILKVAFNAIKYNIPLVFYHPEILDLDIDTKDKEDKLLNVLEELEESREIITDGNTLIVTRIVLDSTNVVNTFFAIAMLSSVIDFWKEKIDKPELDSILETFKELYKNLGLDVNSRFLEGDIMEIKELTKGLDGEKLLLELYAKDSDDQKPRESRDQKRNFFAHSGLLREITIVRKEGDKILLRYDLELMKKKNINIRKWLLNPR